MTRRRLGYRRWQTLAALLAAALLLLTACTAPVAVQQGAVTPTEVTTAAPQATPVPGDRDAVANHIEEHGSLPDYYITKQQARDLGWSGGSLKNYAPGKLIGGDRFGNYEGLLPEKNGRRYTECDINTWGKSSRGAERIVFSNDGLVYYTPDHYESFELLKGTP